ncbi:MAG TPA: hypothetical protein VFH03_11175, partial [Actinoplanes sp.]|nr:hypothetical protein [Actinoplanes sp.]
MRHLRSILYALVLAPAVWILCGASDAGPLSVALLVLAGAAYAILLFAPISPLGPVLAGLIFLVLGGWGVAAPDSYAGIWSAGVTRDGFDLSRPGYALGLVLAVPLLATALNVRRWRGYEPSQLPLIGTLDRARGAAAAPGMPVAEEPTAAFSRAGIAAPVSAPPEPPIEAVPTEPLEPAPAGSVSAEPGAAGPRSSVLVPVAAAGDEPTVVTGADDQPTVVAGTDGEPTVVAGAGDGPTVAASPDSGDDPTIFVVDSSGQATASTPALSAA